MTSVTPTSVIVENKGTDLSSGTSRRLCRIYVEVSPAATNTTDLATYVPNLAAISGMTMNGDSTGSFVDLDVASPATFSTTTVTWNQGATQIAEFIGYYT